MCLFIYITKAIKDKKDESHEKSPKLIPLQDRNKIIIIIIIQKIHSYKCVCIHLPSFDVLSK